MSRPVFACIIAAFVGISLAGAAHAEPSPQPGFPADPPLPKVGKNEWVCQLVTNNANFYQTHVIAKVSVKCDKPVIWIKIVGCVEVYMTTDPNSPIKGLVQRDCETFHKSFTRSSEVYISLRCLIGSDKSDYMFYRTEGLAIVQYPSGNRDQGQHRNKVKLVQGCLPDVSYERVDPSRN
jgi:hypothetical protein